MSEAALNEARVEPGGNFTCKRENTPLSTRPSLHLLGPTPRRSHTGTGAGEATEGRVERCSLW